MSRLGLRRLLSTSNEATTTASPLREAYICGAARTPIGSYGGALRNLSATDLGAIAVKEALNRGNVKPEQVQEVIMGNVLSAGLGQAPARSVCIKANLPMTAVCTTVNKVCSSGLKAIALAAQSVALGNSDVVVAGGMESMSQVPYYAPQMRFGKRMGDAALIDGMVSDGLWDSKENKHMGSLADTQAKSMSISRQDMDGYTTTSYSRAARANSNAAYSDIVKIEGVLENDEEIQRVKLIEKLPQLKPAFDETGSITAGNSSKLSDGAAAVVVVSRNAVDRLELKPKFVIRGFGDAELPPEEFPIAPASAIPIALRRAGISIKEVDLFEINEAFASVVIANNRLMNLNPERVNIYGGAVALGHPIGASGARILTTLLAALENTNTSNLGVAGICNGGGGSTAMVVSKFE
mmetsp:Transcript_5012/g.15035  ORF Transcript_5012/g.15035 Transcript_5012/m.15035 type:complete len:409 (+) Transcript_5012:115-1341(+)